MADDTAWIQALRSSHDRLTRLVAPLDDRGITDMSYDTEWTIADVLSHLGSQAEIYRAFLDAGVAGRPGPGNEEFHQIWDHWNALPSSEQVAQSVRVNEDFVSAVERLSADERQGLSVTMFGMHADFARLAGMRLAEHAVHTWDVAVALDRTATISADAVDLLIDATGGIAKRSGRPVDGAEPVVIQTSNPQRIFTLTLSPAVALAPSETIPPDTLHLPAEALIRLVYGRLDPEHTPEGVADIRLTRLRSAFPGF